VDAMGAACLVNQVHLEHLECLGNLESLELPVCLVCLVLLQHLLVSLLLQHHANHALKDHLARLDPLEHQEIPASLEHLVALVRTPHQALQAPKDHPDQPESQAQMAHLGTPVFLLKANLFKLASPDQLETLAHKDHLDPLDSLVKTDKLDLLDQRDRRDRRVHLVPTVDQELQDHPGHQEDKENVVSVPNIALWTEESSSRTAQGDKRHALDFGYGHGNSVDFLFETTSWLYEISTITQDFFVFIITITIIIFIFIIIIIISIIAFEILLPLSIVSKVFANFTVRRGCDSLLLLRSNFLVDIFYWDGAVLLLFL